ncbi:ArdC family protein, partial [Novosphingobium naphthalenivorans]|uniref:ArdC family protein n=1 Tax=Novosphingobium naphthalenivorans TaxID=273168 RepID=UPI0009FE9223
MRCNSKAGSKARAVGAGGNGEDFGEKDNSNGAGGTVPGRGEARCGRAKGRARGSRKGTGQTFRRGAAGASRGDLYEEVTAAIIRQLEQGRVPWVQPWADSVASACSGAPVPGLPRNALTGRAYSGVNVLILWGAVFEHGWPSQGWLTFRQALEAGGNVRKGEHGTCVVYADRFVPQAEKQRASETGEDARAVPFLKRFTVFNVAQCEGLPAGFAPEPVPLPEREVVPVAEELIAASGVDFRIGGARAFYVPGEDFVQVPPQPAFHDQINYYRTCLHELTHATGHASRLGRQLRNAFGSKDYAREELVA